MRKTNEESSGLIQAQSKIGSEQFLSTNDPHVIPPEKKNKTVKYLIVGGVGVLVLVLAILLPILLSPKDDPVNPPLDHYNPYSIDPKDIQQFPAKITGILKAADEYKPELHGATFQNLMSKLKDDHPLKKSIDTKGIPKSKNNKFVRNLNFTFSQVQWRVSHLVIKDNDAERFSVPEVVVPNPADNLDMRLDMTGFKMHTDNQFGFSFSDPLIEGNTFIDTRDCSLLFMDKFIQMDFKLPSQRLYGFGERIHEFALKEGAWNMWAQGQPSPYDDGSGRKGEYGVHPFILVQSGKRADDFFGIYFRNANAMTPIITFNDDGTSKLSFITIGGQLEIFFFIHGSAQDVIKKYQEFMGARPKLPPFWALGWMQTSYAWSQQSQVEEAVKQYKEQGYPLDAIFLDIPYMDNYVDFTVNKTAFPNLLDLVDRLHANDQHLIPIIDAAISAEELDNTYYTIGNKDEIFIKSTIYHNETYNNNLINQVWPKIAVFVDWFNDKCTNMWFRGLDDLYALTKYDGIWIDMNEPWGFQTAEIDPKDPHYVPVSDPAPKTRRPRFLTSAAEEKDYTWYESFNNDDASTWYLPFIADFKNYQSYDNNTISLNATNPSMKDTQYNLHDFYGHMMSKRTSQYFNQIKDAERADKRNFILTRSTFTSTGQYASHWLGDNYREYAFMNYSIAGVMNFQMFGIPHVGADVCGFFGPARNDKLCAKWSQLATFYPFARFHYDINSPPNEPYLMDEPYKSITKRTMFDRYQYLRLLYTCLWETTKNGGTCFDPLLYYFPADDKVYDEIESTFIFGGSIKVTPSLTDSADTTVPAWFPEAKGQWASLHNLGELLAGGQEHKLDITTQSVNAHLMPGRVIPFQNNSDATIKSYKQLIDAPVSLIVNLDNNGFAKGSLFLDKGEKISELNNWDYEYYNFHVSQKSIQVQFQEGHRGSQAGYNLDSIKFLNADGLKKNTIACYLSVQNKLQPVGMSVEYVESEQALKINADGQSVRFHDIHSIHFAEPGEFNICSSEHFRYEIEGGAVPELRNKQSITMKLTHMAKALPPINATLRILEGGILNIKWTWEEKGRTDKRPYEVPDEYISTNNKALSGDLSQFVAISASPFQISFLDGESQFFRLDGMIFDDYLNWIKIQAFTEKDDNFRGIFGLGERANFDFFYKDGVYSMWSKDIPTPIETGDLPASNMYGNHPYFMYKHKSNSWVGVLYKLAAAQDWWIKNDVPGGIVNVQTVAVGGVADIYLLLGATPEIVTQKYYSIIGNPVLIPQWGLGWNQCRYGYRDVQTLQNVLDGYRNNDFPIDVMWSDIDYMQNYRNFLYDDKIAFKDLPAFIKQVHDLGLKYVPILDAGTAARPLAEDNYPEYLNGVKDNVFMTLNGEPFVGQVWPNDAAYPDFFADSGIKWWQDNLSEMHKLIEFDGLWLDMNEASNFCVGACYPRQVPAKPVKTLLKYVPTGRDLEVQSMPLDTMHADGNISLDTHSLYGIQEIKVTHEWFQKSRETRTFIIERSSFAGMGKWASRWLGDNFSEEKFMKLSVSGVMLMSMFGIPVTGADICGFLGNTNEALCTKWHFVGAFYPFSRNHNGGQVAQEPYVWSKDAQGKMRDAIKLKYSLIRYYYTELFDISTKGTGTFYKPLFFEFPEDPKASANIEYNPMIGSALKLSINPESLTQKTTDFYFPGGLWCRLKGNTNGENCFKSDKGKTKTYPSDLSDYQLHLREGFIVPLQDTTTKPFKTTKDLQTWPVDFHVLGTVGKEDPSTWTAQGRYINDDGESLQLEGNVNSYTLFAKYDGSSTIQVLIGMDRTATNYQTQSDSCTAVNKNDYLASLNFYNAENYQLNKDFDVTVFLKDQKTQTFKAAYDKPSDRLIFQLKDGEEICISTITQIKLTSVDQQ